MTRRDVFSTIKPALDSSPNINSPLDGNVEAPVDLIPTAKHRKKRTRNWDQQHRSETVTFRGVPEAIQQWIISFSESLLVPRDELVRACLEYGIALVRSGKLQLFPQPKSRRMTLFPTDGEAGSISKADIGKSNRWIKDVFPNPNGKPLKGKKNKGIASTLWQQRVTYRIPSALKDEIRTIATDNYLPVGEVVWYFIDLARKAALAGSLEFHPVARIIGKTLFRNDESVI